jgi:hypothetical protein
MLGHGHDRPRRVSCLTTKAAALLDDAGGLLLAQATESAAPCQATWPMPVSKPAISWYNDVVVTATNAAGKSFHAADKGRAALRAAVLAMRNCPLCGSQIDDGSFQVDLSSNYIRYRGECRKAKGSPAEVLYILAKARPRVVPHEDLMILDFGAALMVR